MNRQSSAAGIYCLAAMLPLFTMPAHPQTAWAGTWATAPMRGDHPNIHLAGTTLRQIVHTSVAGDHLRIQVSNLFGDTPLRVEDVHVALHRNASSTVPGSDHRIRFGGQTFVVIPPGSKAQSDAIEVAIPAFADLAVSFYLPSQAGPATFHLAAHQTNYIANGDVSAEPSLHDAKLIGSNYFLTNVDVRGYGARGAVVTLGASITEGYSATENTSNRWPDVLAHRLAERGIGVLNEGISGNCLLVAGAGLSAKDRFELDVIDQPGVHWVIFSDDPINDLGSIFPPPSAAALIAATKQLIEKAHSKHIRFLCSTLTPYEAARYWRPEEEDARQQFNSFVRDSRSGCDGVVDQDAATHDPARPSRLLPGFDSGDHLHPNDAGHKAIGESVDLFLFSEARDSDAGRQGTTRAASKTTGLQH